MLKKSLFSFAVLCFAVVSPSFAEKFKVDVPHSTVGFSIAHLVVSETEGRFKAFSGEFDFDPASGKLNSINAVIQVESIDTGNAKRDNHLRSDDFFDAANHGEITFKSTKITQNGKNYEVEGNLTIKGVSKPITLTGKLKGLVENKGKKIVGFVATGEIDRFDFGLTYSRNTDFGGLVVGKTVTFNIKIEGQT